MGEIDLQSTKVRKIRAEDDVHLKDNRKWCMEFQIFSNGKETIYHIATESEQELNEWMQHLEPITMNNQATGSTITAPPRPPPKKKTKIGFATLKPKKQNINSVEIGSPSPAYTKPDSSSNMNGNSSPGSGVSVSSSDTPPSTPSSSILHEIIETEKDYVNDLRIVRDFYIKTLEEKQLIQKSTKDAIFGNIEELLPIHEQFLTLLTSAYHSPHPDFSDAFELVVRPFSFPFFLILCLPLSHKYVIYSAPLSIPPFSILSFHQHLYFIIFPFYQHLFLSHLCLSFPKLHPLSPYYHLISFSPPVSSRFSSFIPFFVHLCAVRFVFIK